MDNLIQYLNQSYPEFDKITQIAIAHYQFEAIHPFMDGNGRVGRLIIPLSLYAGGVIHSPHFYISEFLEEYRREYYEYLNLVSQENAWLDWIRFFLYAVRQQATKSKFRCNQIEALHAPALRTNPLF